MSKKHSFFYTFRGYVDPGAMYGFVQFRRALFTEALNAYLAGNTQTGKAVLRDLVNATMGFEALAIEVNKPSKSLHRMLGPAGNPSTESFFGIVSALQKKTRVKLRSTGT